MPLLKRTIDRLQYDPAGPVQQVLYDERLPGFGVRVYPSGRKVFILRYRLGGRNPRLLTIGQYGPYTLDKAREEAQRALLSVRERVDPLDARERERKAITMAEFADVYLELHAKRKKRSWKEDERRLRTYVKPALGRHRLLAISAGDVAALHNRISERAPVEANRVVALVSKVFSVAVERNFLPGEHPNPARGVDANPEHSRNRWADETEAPRLLAAIAKEDDPYIRAAFLLFLLTGLRRSELLSLRWGQVDLARREIFLPTTKANRPHRLPLSRAALRVLATIPRVEGNDHVFPGRDRARRYDLKRPWVRVRANAGLENFRLHDLRRTVGSWLATAGKASLPLIGKVLNHSNASTTQIYAHIADNSVREALDEHGDRIMALAAPRRRPPGRQIIGHRFKRRTRRSWLALRVADRQSLTLRGRRGNSLALSVIGV